MTCEDIELALSEMPHPLPAEVVEHLKTCTSCTETARMLSLAALPELTALEQGRLSQMPMATEAAWRKKESQRLNLRRFAGYALAAGLGALITASAFSFAASGRIEVSAAAGVSTTTTVAINDAFDPIDSEWERDDGLDATDETFFEVSWPDSPEGEAP